MKRGHLWALLVAATVGCTQGTMPAATPTPTTTVTTIQEGSEQRHAEEFEMPQWVFPTVLDDDNTYPSEVVSMEEFMENPSKYLDRINLGSISGFPLRVEDYNEFLPPSDHFRWISFLERSKIVVRGNHSGLTKALCDNILHTGLGAPWPPSSALLEPQSFLKNYKLIRRVVKSYPQPEDPCDTLDRGLLLRQLDELRGAVQKEALLTRTQKLRTLDELITLQHEGTEYGPIAPDVEYLVRNAEGFRTDDVQKYVRVRNPEEFKKLALERTKELLDHITDNQNGWNSPDEYLKQMNVIDGIVFSSHLARALIDYARADDEKVRLAERKDLTWTVGDCKQHMAIVVHYLNRVVKPINPNLSDWYFGVQTETIGTVGHAYVVIAHPKGVTAPNMIDVYLFDSTELSNISLEVLGPKNVSGIGRKAVEEAIRGRVDATDNEHYLPIIRYMEDLFKPKLEKRLPKPTSESYH